MKSTQSAFPFDQSVVDPCLAALGTALFSAHWSLTLSALSCHVCACGTGTDGRQRQEHLSATSHCGNRAFPTRVELLMAPRTPPPHTHIGFLLCLHVRLHRKRMESLNPSVAAVLTARCCVYTCSPGMLKSSGIGGCAPPSPPPGMSLHSAACRLCRV